MSGELSDTYAVVDNASLTDKTRNDPVTDVYAEVRKTIKEETSKDTINDGNYALIAPENLDYSLVSYGSACNPNSLEESELKKSKLKFKLKHSKITHKINLYVEKISKPSWMLACLIILTIVIVAAVIAMLITLTLMTRIRSELHAVKSSVGYCKDGVLNLKPKINQLHTEFGAFFQM